MYMYIISYEHILLYPYGYIYIVNYTIYSVLTQQILMKDFDISVLEHLYLYFI